MPERPISILPHLATQLHHSTMPPYVFPYCSTQLSFFLDLWMKINLWGITFTVLKATFVHTMLSQGMPPYAFVTINLALGQWTKLDRLQMSVGSMSIMMGAGRFSVEGWLTMDLMSFHSSNGITQKTEVHRSYVGQPLLDNQLMTECIIISWRPTDDCLPFKCLTVSGRWMFAFPSSRNICSLWPKYAWACWVKSDPMPSWHV